MTDYNLKTQARLETLLSASTSTGAGTAVNQSVENPTFQVTGLSTTSTITVAIQVTQDDTNYVTSGLSFTANGVGRYTGWYSKVRANITAYTSTDLDAVTVTGMV